ncbi:flagellar basal body rod protein FlgC [Heyndrickxia ginsengihumi]|uniref:flagellar basal body rod protein FlgC n=1 Tax=Heyndrickxia ginsengihumi TaxID=363870 RepID=UPI0004715BE8|nr:flagellar basal body rod protein FlgC [Heyndrickxia ginsengihumi]MBE6183866.1 flagellar basal body rod protein FlgC [Bacillus sp. (in: firmicutes)]MCM3022488.1 flagellar basal body rod protein FlgC [Heyndrickxia ginsengihumi]
MSMFSSMNITSSALSAQRLRMDVISSNIANADTTRSTLVNGKWQPYKRKQVVLESNPTSFSSMFQSALGSAQNGNGVKVAQITEDNSPFKEVYNPDDPDADKNGYVQMPNVDILNETVDMMSATRSYEANVTAMDSSKDMLMKTLEIGQ